MTSLKIKISQVSIMSQGNEVQNIYSILKTKAVEYISELIVWKFKHSKII
jgi:hypothetical protein